MTLGPNCGRVRAPDLHLRDLEATHARLVPGGPPLSVRVVERGVLEGGGRAAGQYVVLESSASWMRGQPRRLFLTTDRLRCEGERATDRLEERYGRSFR